MAFGLIYKLTNLVNGKVYVGQTKCSEAKRLREHRCAARKKDPKSAIHRAMAKYGFDNFAMETIDFADSQEELSRKEIEWILKLNSSVFGRGYNLTVGGEGCAMTDPATKAKIGAGTKARWEDPEMRRHYAENVWTPERRAENSEQRKEFYASPGGKAAKEAISAKISKMRTCEACKGVFNGRQWQKHTPSKCPAQVAPPRRAKTDAERLANGNGMRGTKRPMEEVEMRRAALKKRFAEKPWFIPKPSADGLRKIAEASRRRMQTPEARSEKSALFKKDWAERKASAGAVEGKEA